MAHDESVSPGRRRTPDDPASDQAAPLASADLLALAGIADRIDFGLDPDRLVAGDLSQLDQAVVDAIAAAAATDVVRDLAASLGLNPVQLVIALLGLALVSGRAGRRVARAILGGPAPDEVLDLARAAGLDPVDVKNWLRG